MRAMILAAGRGQRLSPITDHTPKPLVEVHSKPLIQHHIEKLKSCGITDIIINTAWLGSLIHDFLQAHNSFDVNIKISHEAGGALDTGGGIVNALNQLGTEPFLVINADVFTDFDFNNMASLSTTDWLNLILVKNPDHNKKGDFCMHKKRLCFNTQPATFTFSGIGLYRPEMFKNQTVGETFSLVPLIKDAINLDKAAAQLHTGQWSDVGTPERLDALNS